MAAITGTLISRESEGSLTQIIYSATTGSTSDTIAIGTGLQVVFCEIAGQSTSAGTSTGGDATYSATTGNVTVVSANQGAIYLIVHMRG